MSDEIKVQVCKYPDRENLVLRYVDPLTGKQKTKSAGTADEEKAIGAAAVWQDELRTGRYAPPSKIAWADFRARFRQEKLAAMPKSSEVAYTVALDHLGRIIGPDRLAKLTPAVMTQFQAKAREGGMKLTTIGRHLRHIKAALRWAERQGMFAKAPTIEMPKLPKGQALMKHRPVTGEEFDRLVEAAPQVRPQDSLAWVRLLRGLWLSGLRLSEAVALSWDEGEPFHLDVSGKYPAFRIMPEGQKSRQPEIAPTTPDFAAWLLVEFPDEGQRAGRVFRVDNLKTGKPIDSHHVGRLVAKIGRKAGVVVGTTEKAVKVEGKPVKKTVKLFATAHDLRRGFCTRWSRKVMPAVLQRLARHAHISTTMSYYVSSTADEIGADLWAAWGKGGSDQAQGNISGNIAPKTTQGVGTHEGT